MVGGLVVQRDCQFIVVFRFSAFQVGGVVLNEVLTVDMVMDSVGEILGAQDLVSDQEAAEHTEVPESTAAADVPVLETPLDALSTTDFLLLLILVVLIIRTVLGLFLRKWGFPDW